MALPLRRLETSCTQGSRRGRKAAYHTCKQLLKSGGCCGVIGLKVFLWFCFVF